MKIENILKINEKIKNVHNEGIRKIIYFKNENMISYSIDKKLKFWIF